MKTESGSVRIEKPTRKLPAASQVQDVESSERFAGLLPSIEAKATTAAANEPAHASVAIQPAVRRWMPLPSTVISPAAPSGRKRQTQAAAVMSSSAQRGQL